MNFTAQMGAVGELSTLGDLISNQFSKAGVMLIVIVFVISLCIWLLLAQCLYKFFITNNISLRNMPRVQNKIQHNDENDETDFIKFKESKSKKDITTFKQPVQVIHSSGPPPPEWTHSRRQFLLDNVDMM